MRYTPNAHPMLMGGWTLDGTESVAEFRAAILTERQRRADHEGRPLLSHERSFPTLELFRMPPAFKAPKPGDGVPKHAAPVAQAIELCERHGAEFWALAPRGRVWGVRDGRYVEVSKHGDSREVDGRTGVPPAAADRAPAAVASGTEGEL